MNPAATVVITTKNRRDDLRTALRSALAQSTRPEVLVIDDGSTDGTNDMVRTEFPGVRLYREQSPAGYIVRRNQAARLALSPIVISMDDDASFPSQRTVEQTLAEFDYPRIGAVAIPFINVRQNSQVHQQGPDRKQAYVTDCYIGTAHAVRRDVFLQVGGYREHFVHQGEEGDYCLRMLAAGYVVRLGTADPIHHFESPRRDLRRVNYFGPRNELLYVMQNVPLPDLLWHLPATTVNCLRHILRVGYARERVAGILDAYRFAATHRGCRRAVSRRAYRLSRMLKRSGPRRITEIQELLPPLQHLSEL